MNENAALFGAGVVGLVLLVWSCASFAGGGATLNIYDQQRINRRWTIILISVFVVFVGFLGLGVDVFFLGMKFPLLGLNVPEVNPQYAYGTRAYWRAMEDAQTTGVPVGTIAAVLGALLMSWLSYQNGPAMILAAAHARDPDLKDPKEAQLVNVVQELSVAAGLPMPQVHIVPDDDMNAFATGTGPEHAHIAVTSALLKGLNREELQGVISHELSHIRNADVELMTVVVALAGAAALLSDWSSRGVRLRGGRDDSKGGGAAIFFVVWLVFMILAPILSQLIALAVSRRREYLADASGAELTRNPMSLASALEKIHKSIAEPDQALAADSFSHLCIDDPRGRSLNDSDSSLADLLSTHPPIEKRIQALKEMAYIIEKTPSPST